MNFSVSNIDKFLSFSLISFPVSIGIFRIAENMQTNTVTYLIPIIHNALTILVLLCLHSFRVGNYYRKYLHSPAEDTHTF